MALSHLSRSQAHKEEKIAKQESKHQEGRDIMNAKKEDDVEEPKKVDPLELSEEEPEKTQVIQTKDQKNKEKQRKKKNIAKKDKKYYDDMPSGDI